MNHALIHRCNIETRRTKQKLSFDTGSVAFVVGETVIATDSGAEGLIERLVLETGTWVGGTAAGYMVLKDVRGQFIDDEGITTNDNGVAVVNGVNIDFENAHGELERYWDVAQESIRCKLYFSSKRVRILEAGENPVRSLMCWLPANAVVDEHDYRIITSQAGFEGNYNILSAMPRYAQHSRPTHYEVELDKVVE